MAHILRSVPHPELPQRTQCFELNTIKNTAAKQSCDRGLKRPYWRWSLLQALIWRPGNIGHQNRSCGSLLQTDWWEFRTPKSQASAASAPETLQSQIRSHAKIGSRGRRNWRSSFHREQTQFRDLAAHFARGLLSISLPSNQRAQGMPGAGAPAAARVVVVSTRVSHHEYAGNTRHSPRNGFNGFLRALPGDRALLPPSLTFRFRQLDTSVGVSGPHDFAVRIGIARLARRRVHRIPPRRP